MLLDLLREIQEQVLSHCDDASLKNLARCSNQCNELVHEKLWRSVRITSFHLSNHHFVCVKKLENLRYAKVVRFSRTDDWGDIKKRIHQDVCANYIAVLDHCNPQVFYADFIPKSAFRLILKFSHLLELHLVKTSASDLELQKICKKLIRLKVLSMKKNVNKLTRRGFVHINLLTHLQELDLEDCDISDTGFSSVCTLVSLKRLNIASCYKISDSGFSEIVSLINLEDVDLSHCVVSDVGLSYVCSLIKLTKLNLNSCFNISGAGALHITKLTSLRELDLSDCNICETGLAHLSSLPDLIKLNLSMCYNSDVGVAHISRMSTLMDLDISGCYITDVALNHVSSLVRLTTLDISTCYSVSDVGLADVCKLTSLKDLNLCECYFSHLGLSNVSSLVQLIKLNLSSCQELNDDGVAHISKLRTLKEVYLRDTKITDLSLSMISNLSGLEVLDLGRCPSLSNDGLAHLMTLVNLIELDLTYSSHITGEGVAKLNKLKSLKKLRHCVKTDDDMHYVSSMASLHLRDNSEDSDDDDLTDSDSGTLFANEVPW